MSRRSPDDLGAPPSLARKQRLRRRSRALPEGVFEARIEDLSEEGDGVARIDGKVCFIAGALPGEHVRFAYTHVGRDLDQGRVTDILERSPDRSDPPCAHFGVCGGCTLQHLAPAAQVALKQARLLQALKRIGGVEPDTVAEPITGPTTGYRRRARLGVRHVSQLGRALVGFRERASSRLALLDRCEVLDERVGAQLAAFGRLIGSLELRRQVPQIEVTATNEVVLVFRVLEAPSEADRDRLRAFARESGLHVYLQPRGPDSVAPLDAPGVALHYAPDGGGDLLQLAPADFIQVNGEVSQRSVRQALAWLDLQPGQRVLELFSGLGNFSIPLARGGAQVTAVEGEAGLVSRARDNAERLGLDIAFHVANLFEPPPSASWLQHPYDAVLLDPPRAGAQEMMPLLLKLQPARIVYVSCQPATLARDAGLLCAGGYRLRRAGVMDMFPHTAHVESMALFERASR